MKLNDIQKKFIIERLAMFDTPKTVAAAVKEEFGIAVDRRQVANYDVEKRFGHLSEKYRTMFWATRSTFIETVGAIPIAQRAFRLRRMQQGHDKMMESGNIMAAMQILEQAAKEAGNVFTNETKVKGRVNHDHEGQVEFKAQENRATLSDLIDQALRKTAEPDGGETTH